MNVEESVATRRATPRPRAPRAVAMAGLATAMFLVIMDASMVNLAGPAIREGLGLSGTELSVVADAYLVAFAGLLLLGGRFADILGGRRMFGLGLSVYTAATVACALATSGTLLTAARVVQGVGAAMVIPAALSLVLALYPTPAERTRALGLWGAVAGLGSLVGVFLGGAVTQSMGWQAVFWIPVPVALVAVAVVFGSVPHLPGRPGRFDIAGALTITIGVSALALGVIFGSEVGWASTRTLLFLAVGLTGLVAFVIVEHRSTHPLVPLRVFRRRPVAAANLMILLLGGTMTSLFFFLPQYQHHTLDMDAASAGMSQLPIALMIIVGSGLAPLLAKLLGPRRATPLGIAVLFGGLLWLALDPTTSGFSASLFGAFTLIGLGLGLGLVSVTATAVRDAAADEGGMLSGLVNATQQLGGALGLAVLVGISATGTVGSTGDIAYSTAFGGLAAFALAALALSFLPLRKPTDVG